MLLGPSSDVGLSGHKIYSTRQALRAATGYIIALSDAEYTMTGTVACRSTRWSELPKESRRDVLTVAAMWVLVPAGTAIGIIFSFRHFLGG